MNGCQPAEGGFFCTLNGIRHFVRTAGVAAPPSDGRALAGVRSAEGASADRTAGGAAAQSAESALAGADAPSGEEAPADAAERPTPLILLHGFMQDSRVWELVMESLAQDRPVYALDFAGFGRSDTPAGTLPYRVEETVAGIRDLVDLVAGPGGRAHVLGYSMGGRMALSFVHAHADCVASLVLESAGMGADTPEARAAVNARDAAWVERLRTCSIEKFVDYWEGLPLFAGQAGMDPALRAALRRIRLSCDVDVLSRCIQGAGQHAMPYFAEAVRNFRMPILYVAGVRDEKYTKVALRLAARGDAVCSLLACGHSVHLEQPASFVDHVRPFLALCDGRRAEGSR